MDAKSEVALGKDLECLLVQRAKLLEELQTVEGAIDVAQVEYDALVNWSSPVFKLSDDIIELIFIEVAAATRNNRLSSDNNGPDSQQKPLTELALTRVCSRFRTIALLCRQLWGHFTNGGRGTESQLLRFKVYLERSRGYLLQLSIGWSAPVIDDSGNITGAGGAERRVVRSMIRLALIEMHRWQQVAIFIEGSGSELEKWKQFMRERQAPQLEYFYIDFRLRPYARNKYLELNQTRPKVEVFRLGAPKLKYLDIGLTSWSFLPPISNLTTLCLGDRDVAYSPPGIPWMLFLNVVETLPLVALSIADVCMDISPNSPKPTTLTPIYMPFLQHLRWGYTRRLNQIVHETELLFSFLPYLNARSLETLLLRGVDFPQSTPPNASMSFPKLDSIRLLHHGGMSNLWFRFFAKVAPNVTKVVSLGEGTRTAYFAENISIAQILGSKPLWTKLEYLLDANDSGRHIDISYFAFILEVIKTNGSGEFSLKVSSGTLKGWKEDCVQRIEYRAFESVYEIEELTWDEVYPREKWSPGDESCGVSDSILVCPLCFAEPSG